jgi:hypothetical protein
MPRTAWLTCASSCCTVLPIPLSRGLCHTAVMSIADTFIIQELVNVSVSSTAKLLYASISLMLDGSFGQHC